MPQRLAIRRSAAPGLWLALAALACAGGGSGGPAKLVSIALTPAAVSLPAGASTTIAATARRSDGSTADVTAGTTFTTSNPAVALVRGGLVFAIAPGVATVTATDVPSGCTAAAVVTVGDARLEAITVSPQAVRVPQGLERALTAMGHYSDGTAAPLPPGDVTWTTSAPGVALVSAAGLVHAQAVGSATVTASHGPSGLSAGAAVTVTNATLSWLTLDPAGAYLFAGYGLPVVAVGHFSDGSSAPLPSGVAWSTSSALVASVVAGRVEGIGEGTASVTATHVATGVAVSDAFQVSPTRDVSFPAALPQAGSVGTGYALYRVNGLTPGAWYRVTLGAPSADVQLYVADLPGLDAVRCASTQPGTATETCLVEAPPTLQGAATLYVFADGTKTAAGATFTLDVSAAPGPTYDVLAYPAALPHAGSVDGMGHTYAVTGLAPGAYYAVTLDGLAGDADLSVYTDAALTQLACFSNLAGTSPEVCAVVAPPGGTLLVGLAGPSAATPFRLDVRALAPPAPLLATALPVAAHVDGYVAYAVGPLAPGAPYVVTLGGLTADADLRVFADAALTQLLCDAITPGNATESCVARPAGTRLYVAVDATPAAAGADVRLDVAPWIPPPLSRTFVAGVDLPAAGSLAAGFSRVYYRVTGLVPGASYVVTLAGLAADVDLFVHDSPDLLAPVCGSDRTGTAPDACLASADAAGELFVELDPYDGLATPFTLDLTPAPILTSSGLPATLSVAPPGALYALDGLTPAANYLLVLANPTGDVALKVWGDAQRLDLRCASSLPGTSTEQCTFVAPASGRAYVDVDATNAPLGATFTVNATLVP